MLDTAEKCLRETSEKFNLDVLIIRKERATGLIARNATTHIKYEILEEIALSVQEAIQLTGSTVPYCAFNGGHDVFVDVGHKALGIQALQGMLGVKPHETAHAGDRFTATGNDLRAREVALTLWVANPTETEDLLELLLEDIHNEEKHVEITWYLRKFSEFEIERLKRIANRIITIGQPLSASRRPHLSPATTPSLPYDEDISAPKMVATNFEGTTSPEDVQPQSYSAPTSARQGVSGDMAFTHDERHAATATDRLEKTTERSTSAPAPAVVSKIGTPVFSPATVAADARMEAMMLDAPDKQDSTNISVISLHDLPEDDGEDSISRLSLESDRIPSGMLKSASLPDFTSLEKIRSIMSKDGKADADGLDTEGEEPSGMARAQSGMCLKSMGESASRSSSGIGARGFGVTASSDVVRGAEKNAISYMRSHWDAAGASIVGEVRPIRRNMSSSSLAE